jgi:hypothetical protein
VTTDEPVIDVEPFGVTRLSRIPANTGPAWLIEPLWAARAVGLLGGPPKVGKSFLGLEMALAVASNTPCLGRFPVHAAGPVLVYCIEDGRESTSERMRGLCVARGVDFDRLMVGWLDADRLALDRPGDQLRLAATVKKTKARLLLLDPLVRLHRGDESSSQDISRLLSFLRAIQQEHGVAIVVVHHMRKAPTNDPGQALRGSGDLHAWSDSALYYAKGKPFHRLSIEHRSRPARRDLAIQLAGDPPRLLATDAHDLSLAERVLAALADGHLTRTDLRERLGVRNEDLADTLRQLEQDGRVRRTGTRVALPNYAG